MRVWLSRDSCIDSASSYIWNCVYLELVWTWDRGRVCLWCTQVYVVADVVETGPADVTFQFKVIFLSETKMMLIELDGTWISQSLPYVWHNVFLWPPHPPKLPQHNFHIYLGLCRFTTQESESLPRVSENSSIDSHRPDYLNTFTPYLISARLS